LAISGQYVSSTPAADTCAPTLARLRRIVALQRRLHRAFERRAQQPGARPDRDARWPDGTLVGWRYWHVTTDGYVASPFWPGLWSAPRGVLRARGWSTSKAVEGRGGIHAYWPAQDGHASKDMAARLAHEACDGLAMGLVAGWGEVVTGEIGWRAEYAAIQALYAPPWHVAALRRRYPHVPVEPLMPAVLARGASLELRSKPERRS